MACMGNRSVVKLSIGLCRFHSRHQFLVIGKNKVTNLSSQCSSFLAVSQGFRSVVSKGHTDVLARSNSITPKGFNYIVRRSISGVRQTNPSSNSSGKIVNKTANFGGLNTMSTGTSVETNTKEEINMGATDKSAEVLRRVDNVTKSDEDKRLYRGLELRNGLKVLLVSDPETDKSAAALDVHIGNLSDPEELQGLAHFCEHMLFLGTERYPDENEYSKYLSQNGGSFNAYTAGDHTNYYFDVSPDSLEGALDRFSQFFLCPLFTESATDREVNAVNSEHEKNIPNDLWRINQINRSNSIPNHPYHKFGTGNKKTLDILPKERGISVRDELLKFHKKWYSSNIMSLVVLGQQSLDELEKMILDRFSAIENKEVQVPEWTDFPYGEEQCKTITYLVPVKDIRKLNITWCMKDYSDEYKSIPGAYLAHLIGHEGPGSLLSELKVRGWVNNLVAGNQPGAKGFAFFIVNVDLSEEGLDHVDDIVELVFQYLSMLRADKPQEWVYEECRDLNAMQFRFRDKEAPQSYVCLLASQMQQLPLEDALTGGFLLTEFKPHLTSEIIDMLTPDKVRVCAISQKFKDRCESVEPWYQAQYHVDKIPEEKLEKWSKCEKHPNLRLPDKNDFIPSQFDLVQRDTCSIDHPTIVQEDKLGRLWFMQDYEFLLPKTCINIEMKSTLAYSDPHHANLTYMMAVLIKDELTEFVYAAELAGLGYNLANTKSGITLAIKGYSDKQKVLLDKIMDKLTNFKVNEKRFEILKETYCRGLKNFRADQPYQHAIYYNSTLLSDVIWHKEELLECIDLLTVEEVQQFIPRLLSNLTLECLVYGNATVEGAKDLYNSVVCKLTNSCKTRPLLPSQVTRDREVQLVDKRCIYETENTVHKSSSVECYYQCGVQSTRANMLLELYAQIINESCYDTLRTKEQLGYIVFSGVRRSKGAQGLRIIVQSAKHPEFLEGRIENYLAGSRKYIEKMTDAEFEEQKEALATKRLEKPKKLAVKNGRFWSEILSQHYNFDRANVEVECLRKLTKEDILVFYDRHVSKTSEDRRKLSCHVISTAPDGAGAATTEKSDEESSATDDYTEPNEEGKKVKDVAEFKAARPLYPLVQPYVPKETLFRK